jgi:hypothetical protein
MTCSKTLRGCARSGPLGLLTWATYIFILLLVPSTAQAQVEVEGHASLGVGIYSNRFTWGFGDELTAGGEILIANRFGLLGQVDLLGGIYPTMSLGGTFHLAHDRGAKLEKFVQVAMTRLSGDYGNVDYGWKAGGGATYWVGPRVGFRFEFAETVVNSSFAAKHYVARFGATFR